MESLKELGITEKSQIADQPAHKRPSPNQTPKKPAGEKASKGGKSFKIK